MDLITSLQMLAPNLAKNIPLPKNDTTIYDYLEENIEHTMFLDSVDDLEIIRTVQNCKNKISTDFSDISMSLLKKVISKIVKPFAHMCNVSFQTGVFPNKMKIAKVIQLYMSGEKNVFTNYRPISLLPQFSKILEKLYNNRLDEFLNKCNILSPSQNGFRSSMSTTEALLDLVEEITSSLEKNKYTVGVFIDLKKAFDTVDHDILCKKNCISMVCVVSHRNGLRVIKKIENSLSVLITVVQKY